MADDLKLVSLRKKVGDFVLEADFTVKGGERAALVGRSGIGKTTLLRLIVGLETPEQGQIFLGTSEITPMPARERQIGMIFQESSLFPELSVLENAEFGLKVRGRPRDERRAQVLEWLDRVGMKKDADREVTHLSGGEIQRVAFVRALIWKPRALLLDEPFSALDQGLRHVLRQNLMDLHRLWPVPIVLVSHNLEDVEFFSTRRLEFSENPLSGVRRVR